MDLLLGNQEQGNWKTAREITHVGDEELIFINEIRYLYEDYLRCENKKIKQMIHDDILSLVAAIEVMEQQV